MDDAIDDMPMQQRPVRAPLIGILGGMGPFSTVTFLDLVAAARTRLHGARHDIDFPRVLVCSQTAPFYPDRAPDHEAITAATLGGLRTLDRAGWTSSPWRATPCMPTMGGSPCS